VKNRYGWKRRSGLPATAMMSRAMGVVAMLSDVIPIHDNRGHHIRARGDESSPVPMVRDKADRYDDLTSDKTRGLRLGWNCSSQEQGEPKGESNSSGCKHPSHDGSPQSERWSSDPEFSPRWHHKLFASRIFAPPYGSYVAAGELVHDSFVFRQMTWWISRTDSAELDACLLTR
jgi:hypothetical protein